MMPEPSTTAFLFPGQGSQVVGMGRALAEAYPLAAETFAQADVLLGFPLSRLAFEGPEADLNDTYNTQPALFVHSVAVLRVFNQLYPGFSPAFVAGHSMGELSALVAAQAFDFKAGLRLVRRRGELMKQAGEISPGGMAAILGLDIPTMENICSAASSGAEVVQVANDNCPGQVVISGSRAALERAVQQARQAGARRAVTLAVSIAAHSPLMAIAQNGFNQAVAETPLVNPAMPVFGNVTASPLVTADQVRSDLQAQLNARVRWTESIQSMIAQGVTTFIELGSESVLTGLLKRIDRGARGLAIGAPPEFDKLTAASA
ncbi:MAG TPA: ACP S-malonyltransferase [Anaerolineales bacterium]|nr:ACP S-malonyltransferase [Anaerolineales bacterium]